MLKTHVASVCFIYVAIVLCGYCKVDHDVAYLQWLYTYIAKVCFQCFICVFGCMLQVCACLDVAYVSHICCKCFIWIYACFAMIFTRCLFCKCVQKHVSSVSSAFKRMLQVLHLNV
jgi:hypothetical protein